MEDLVGAQPVIPMGRLSTTPVPAAFYSPDDIDSIDPLTDYEMGGVALSDASAGLQDRIWTARADLDGNVYLSAPENVETLFITLPGITELSFTFDQNMRPVLAYMQGGVARLRWFNTVPNAYVVTDLPAGSMYPRVALDDKRARQTTQGDNDVILAYMRSGDLYYRQQRDRYEDEYLLKAGVNAKLIRIGMNMLNRLQFMFEEL